MYIVSFYSSRGGVGCTTALVNVGFELARRGRKVLLIDFDLESPDLASFPSLDLPESQPGVVEYVTAYRETDESPEVAKYCYSIPIDGLNGELWVMPAGEVGPSYWEALADIDWQGLYDCQDGYLFFEDTRAQWQRLGFDYVLIDTHAGITPALGISTRQLADAVVMMYNPPQQTEDAGLDEVSCRIAGEAKQTGRKPIRQFFVASRVLEADEPSFLEHEYHSFETAGGDLFPVVAWIPFSHRLLLKKKQIVCQANADTHLAEQYRRLVNELIAVNYARDRDGAMLLLRKMYDDPATLLGTGRSWPD